MMLNTDLPVLLLLFSPLTAAVISLAGKVIPSRYCEIPAFALWIAGSCSAILLSFPAVISGDVLQYAIGGWAEPLGIALEINGVTWIAALTDIIIALAAWLCTRRYGHFGSLFYFFFFMALFSLQGVLCTRDIFNLFVWFEVLSLSSFILISYDGSLTARLAAIRYLLISSMSILFFLVGVWIIYRLFGVLSLREIASAVMRADVGKAALGKAAVGIQKPLLLAAVLMTAGILTRAAIVPFHTWLPDAHAAAPFQVSALLSGFVIKAPMLALWKIYQYIDFPGLRAGLIWTGGICALWGVAAAMVQKDAKRLLGYHSVSQMGYIIAAFGAGSPFGLAASLFYIIAHALFKSLLFLTVGYVTDQAGTRDVYTLRGAARSFPLYTVLYLIAAASISGIPLFAGFTGKIAVAKSIAGHPAYIFLLMAGVGTAASFIKLSLIFFRAPRSRSQQSDNRTERVQHAGTASAASAASGAVGMGIIAVGCLLMGVFPQSIQQLLLDLVQPRPSGYTAGLLNWYSFDNILKSLLTFAAGIIISVFLLSEAGKKISHRMRTLAVGLNGSLRLITAGFALLILYSLFLSF